MTFHLRWTFGRVTPRIFSVACALPNGALAATTFLVMLPHLRNPLRIAFDAPSLSRAASRLLMASMAAPSISAVMAKDPRRDIVRESLVPVLGVPRREWRVECGQFRHGDARDLARRRA
jgi:hypothetical protein